MEWLFFLIAFPCIIAALLLFIKHEQSRAIIVYGSSIIIACASIASSLNFLSQHRGVSFAYSSLFVDWFTFGIDIALGILVLAFAFKHKQKLPFILALVQLIGAVVFEFLFAHDIHVTESLSVDGLSILMILIIGIVGGGICIYALGYMNDFHKLHPEVKDRRPLFFALMFIFLSAMFALVVSNNMMWMLCAWEITTVCSFLLIGYTQTAEAYKSAFRQIWMNLLGGIAFLTCLFFCAFTIKTLAFDEFVGLGLRYPLELSLPIALLAFAGLTKAAQMPFHTWLLGAMVAPTPTSALLHSSTMVKAGVFLLLKMSPLFIASFVPAAMVIATGGLTFLFCSFMAISQSNAKRVLAYSTIANLGLIVACAGVGSPAALWAAAFLILFHALAKSLLFLCVGSAEHRLGSRDIEDMDLLFERSPKLARLMMLGIMGMFIAPFGMLLAKWATLVSFIDAGQLLLILLLAFGSAATFMFWAKWLGKLSSLIGNRVNELDEARIPLSEWVGLDTMAILLAAACIFLPWISDILIEPYIMSWYGFVSLKVSYDNMYISALSALIIFAILFGGLSTKNTKAQSVYLAGASHNNQERVFVNSLGATRCAEVRNWYMLDYFSEEKLQLPATIVCACVIVLALLAALMAPQAFTAIL